MGSREGLDPGARVRSTQLRKHALVWAYPNALSRPLGRILIQHFHSIERKKVDRGSWHVPLAYSRGLFALRL